MSFTAAGINAIDLSVDDPPPGALYGYIVTGSNAVGEGSPGNGTGGLRIVNPDGTCTP